MLTPEQQSHYNEHGFIILNDFKSLEQVEELRRAALAIVDDFDAEAHRTQFTTQDMAHAEDEYFITSGDKVRCFFEGEAFDDEGVLKQEKALSINKIGHAMHDLDPAFEKFSRDPRLAGMLRDIGIVDPRIWQSMYIFKQPRIGGEVRWHQDATYFFTDPITVTTLWFAIDDATEENGCLWIAKSGHNTPLRERFYVCEGRGQLETLNQESWPTEQEAFPVPVKAGSLVCFHGLLPHYSAPNRSNKARHAFTLHVTDASAEYAPTNWIQRTPAFPVRGFDLG